MRENVPPPAELTLFQRQWLEDATRGEWAEYNPITGLVNTREVRIPMETRLIPLKFGMVTGGFDCSGTAIETLVGCPDVVGGTFDCSGTQITSLMGGPRKVKGNFLCNRMVSTFSLVGAPNEVGGIFTCLHTALANLDGLPAKLGETFCCTTPFIAQHVLRLFNYPQINNVVLSDVHVAYIVNKYLSTDRDVLLCQDELINAGHADIAKL